MSRCNDVLGFEGFNRTNEAVENEVKPLPSHLLSRQESPIIPDASDSKEPEPSITTLGGSSIFE